MRNIVEKTKNVVNINNVLSDVMHQLDTKTDMVVEEVLAKRKSKGLYVRARENVKSYFSKKKEEKEITKREKTLGTPCFEELSNCKIGSGGKMINHTLKSKKSMESTGHKLSVVKKSSASMNTFKDTIGSKRPTAKLDEIYVQEFRL
jgi:hypothetical protein